MADDVGLYWTLFQGEFPGESIIMYTRSLHAGGLNILRTPLVYIYVQRIACSEFRMIDIMHMTCSCEMMYSDN